VHAHGEVPGLDRLVEALIRTRDVGPAVPATSPASAPSPTSTSATRGRPGETAWGPATSPGRGGRSSASGTTRTRCGSSRPSSAARRPG
jgi:hypothetical protein